MKLKHQQSSNRSTGFTLVEIMVAIALSLILIAGVMQVYLSSKESFRVQNELSGLQENQRIALEFMRNDIARAGFSPQGRVPGITEFVNRSGANSDEITVSYSAQTDCLGVAPPGGPGALVVNRYFIDENTNQLMCDGNGEGANGGMPAQPIADGVENMQILYGEDKNTQIVRPASADVYLNASDVNMNRVVSVRIALLFKTMQPIRTKTPSQQNPNVQPKIDMLDSQFTLPDDRFKRQLITTTIPLRNAM